MPELPEVETVVRTLSPQIVGATITKVSPLLAKSLQKEDDSLLPLLSNATITKVYRRAKLILVEVEAATKKSVLTLAFHLKMTGRFFVHPANTAPLKHTRLIFDIITSSQLPARLFFDDMRTFGYCRVMQKENLSAWDFWQQLGIEPLSATPQDIALRLQAHSGNIKSVLLNQHVVVGIGNIYADESLFRAGISPMAKAATIPLHRLESLAIAIQDVLQQAIDECGSSIRDYRDANGDAGSFQNNFFVYGRKG